MDPPARRHNARGIKAVRPGLLAGGLGLMWFVLIQKGEIDADAPSWAIALIFVGRLFVDVVGAWLAVSVVRLMIALLRLAFSQWRAQSEKVR
jgi:hypothetical protein